MLSAVQRFSLTPERCGSRGGQKPPGFWALWAGSRQPFPSQHAVTEGSSKKANEKNCRIEDLDGSRCTPRQRQTKAFQRVVGTVQEWLAGGALCSGVLLIQLE